MDKDLNAEACLLSGVINQPDFILTAITELDEEKFYHKPHKIIFREMRKMFLDNIDIGIITLIDRLKTSKKLKEVGGFNYINELSDVVVSAANGKSWIKIINDKYLLRKLRTVSKQTEQACKNPDRDASEILEKAQSDVLGIMSNKKKAFKNLGEISNEFIHKKEQQLSGNLKEAKYYTGLTYLDSKCDIKKGKLVVISADRSVGKSVLGGTIAFLNAKQLNSKVGIFNMEMSPDEILEREISRSGKIDLDSVIHPNYDKISIISKEIDEINELSVLIDDTAAQPLSTIRAKSMQMKHELKGLDLIVIDYLQLMKATDGDNREQKVAALSRGLKAIAKDLDIAVIALSQVNSDGKTRESRAIEQDCDILIRIVRPRFENDNQDIDIEYKSNKITVTNSLFSLIILSKNRQGETGITNAWLNGKHQRFDDYNGQMEQIN